MKALVAAAALVAALSLVPSAFADRFSATVSQILAQPYQPDYVPLGLDSAFDGSVPNTLPAEDYTTGRGTPKRLTDRRRFRSNWRPSCSRR